LRVRRTGKQPECDCEDRRAMESKPQRTLIV
jgi:hypothetical protein